MMFTKLLLSLLLVNSILTISSTSEKFQIKPRIINGQKARTAQFPYIASLREKKKLNDLTFFEDFCGAGLISDYWVISAAHCFDGRRSKYISNTDKMRIIVGTNHVYLYGTFYEVESINLHDEFNPLNYKNDVVLIKTQSQVIFGKSVRPLAISKKWIVPGKVGVFCGFGCTDVLNRKPKDIKHPENLWFISLRVVRNEECLKMHPPVQQTWIHNSSICTFTDSKTHACFGDSGAPLVIDNQLVGIDSWGTAAKNGYPDLFTRISEFTQWIEDLTGIKAA